MGQDWCKEKSSKAQVSKSPLDKVFLRCAHTIYPSQTVESQLVTRSKIGYAETLAARANFQRGPSIDSVDRPFHPSDWVDVNLEVPCTAPSSYRHLGTDQPVKVHTARNSNFMSYNTCESNGIEKPQAPVPPPRKRRTQTNLDLIRNENKREDEVVVQIQNVRPPTEESPDVHATMASGQESVYTVDTLKDVAKDGTKIDCTTSAKDEWKYPFADTFKDLALSTNTTKIDQSKQNLRNRSAEDITPIRTTKEVTAEAAVRPKNHSTTSLPCYEQLWHPEAKFLRNHQDIIAVEKKTETNQETNTDVIENTKDQEKSNSNFTGDICSRDSSLPEEITSDLVATMSQKIFENSKEFLLFDLEESKLTGNGSSKTTESTSSEIFYETDDDRPSDTSIDSPIVDNHSALHRTISEESLPKEMQEEIDIYVDEDIKLALHKAMIEKACDEIIEEAVEIVTKLKTFPAEAETKENVDEPNNVKNIGNNEIEEPIIIPRVMKNHRKIENDETPPEKPMRLHQSMHQDLEPKPPRRVKRKKSGAADDRLI